MTSDIDTTRCEYALNRTSSPPDVDGWLEAPCWKQALWVERFVAMDTWASAKPAAVALLWDATALYVGMKPAEPQLGMIRSESAPVEQDDLVEIYLDPGIPEVQYVVLGINAQGDVGAHKMIIDNPGWGTRHPFVIDGMRCAARLTGAGWQIELAIPFAGLGGNAPAPGDRWHGNVCRMDRLAYSWSFWALEEPVRYSYDDHKLFPALRFESAEGPPSGPQAAPAPRRAEKRAWPDQPRFAMRGFMYDTSRGSLIYTPEFWRARLPFFREMGFNTILMYFENHLRYASHGAFAPEGSWSIADLTALQESAAQSGIDIIPAQTSLGHCTGILKHPDYREYAEDGSDGYQFCVAHPGSRRVLTEMFGELAAASRSPCISINADESAYLGLCPRCRAAFPGWSKGRIFMHHILPIYEVIRDHGKRMMMWDDMPWLYPEAIEELPRDVILLDWHYSLHRRYPSIERWRALGFDIVACPGMYRVENAFWIADHGADQGAMGLVNTLWEDHCFPLGSRWQHFAATSWAAHAAAPEDVDAWYALAGDRLFGADGSRLGRSVAAQDNIGRNAYRIGAAASSTMERFCARQVLDTTERLLAAQSCTGQAREWLEEFLYARKLIDLEDAVRSGRDTGEAAAARLTALRTEGMSRWQRQCPVPSQLPAFTARFERIAAALPQRGQSRGAGGRQGDNALP